MFRIENVWQKNDPGLLEKIKKLATKSRGTITHNEADKMITSVVFVAWSADNHLTGFSAAVKHSLSLLNNNALFELSLVIDESFHQSGIERELTERSFDFLSRLAENDPQQPVGVFSVLRNEKDKNKITWPERDMYLVGFTKNDFPIAVHYFKGARI